MPSKGNLISVSYEYFHVDWDMGEVISDNVDEVCEVKLIGELAVNRNVKTLILIIFFQMLALILM